LVLKTKLISTGNEELDLKLAGGLPVPLLMVIEGEHGTGKTVLVQQFVYGALKSGLRVVVITTETTTVGYIRQMLGVGFNILDYFIKGDLKVYSTRLPRVRWVESTGRDLLALTQDHMIAKIDTYDIYVIDSFSILIKGSKTEDIANFLTTVRKLVDKGKSFILTIHPGGLEETIYLNLKAIADGYMELKNAEMGGRVLKVMNIIKLKGVPTTFDNVITFDIDPAFGIKLVPMALSKV